MRPFLPVLASLLALGLQAQQPELSTAHLHLRSASFPISGSQPPYALRIELPSSPTIHFRGLGNQFVGLWAAPLQPGFLYVSGMGSVDIDLGSFYTIFPFGALVTSPAGTVDLPVGVIGPAFAGAHFAIQGLLTDPTSFAGATLTPAHDLEFALGTTVDLALTDDSSALRVLQYNPFPFYGQSYTSIFVNSNGNLTFQAGSTVYTETIAGMLSGPPRIAALWDDFDPGVAGRVIWSERPGRIKVEWLGVPEYATSNRNSLVAALAPTGKINICYGPVATVDGIVGISPGFNLSPVTSPISLNGGVHYGIPYEAIFEQDAPPNNFPLAATTLTFQDPPGPPAAAYDETPCPFTAYLGGNVVVYLSSDPQAHLYALAINGQAPYNFEWVVLKTTNELGDAPKPTEGSLTSSITGHPRFETPGTYWVTVWITDANGKTAYAMVEVTVLPC